MTQRIISLEQLSRQLMECAILVKKGERSPLLTQTIHDLTDYMTSVAPEPPPSTVTAPSISTATSDDGEDDSLRTVDTPNSTTLAKHHGPHKHPHAFAVLGKMVGLSPDETPVRSDASKQATSSKNAARVKSDLADMNHQQQHKDPDWCEEHFTRGCACKQRKAERPTSSGGSVTRSAKPAFQRPANPKSSLIANGWIEQQRRSKMRVVWKDVLASLVEGRRPGEETTLWIQREVIGSSGKKELEALHQIPIKWLQDITYLNYSHDNRFTLKVYNLSDDFIFRCQNDPEAAQNWVLTLRSMKEVAQRGSVHAAANKTGVDDWNQLHHRSEIEDEKKVESQQNAQQYIQQQQQQQHYAQQQQQVPVQQQQYTPQQQPQRPPDHSSQRMTITELRAIAHGAGVQTHGMERGELEHIVAQIAQAGGFAAAQTSSPQQAPVPAPQASTVPKPSAVPISPTATVPSSSAGRAAPIPSSPPMPVTPQQPAVASTTDENQQQTDEDARKRKEEYDRRLKEQQEEQERRRKIEEARQRQLEEERARKEAEEKRKREEADRLMAERVRQKQEEERKAREEAERKRLEEERIRRDEEELRRRAAEKKAAEERMRQEEAARLQQQQWQQQQQAWMKQQQEEEQRRRIAEQQAAEERRRQEEIYRRHQQQWQQAQQQQQPGYGAPPHQHFPGGHPPQNPQYHAAAPPPGQPRPTPQANNIPNGAPPPQMNSPINVKYAQMAQQNADENQLSIQSVKHGVLLQWALQPPMFQVLRPIHVLLVTIHTVFPPKFGVKGHEYFSKWTAIKPEEVTLGPTQGHRPDDEKIKKCVRKLRLFLHPDKLPKDLDEYQQFMCKMLWDISSDAWEEHKKREEELGWIRG